MLITSKIINIDEKGLKVELDKEIDEKKKWMEEFPENGRYLPVKINQNEKVVMMDSQTGDLYFPSPAGWKLDMTKINKK